MHAPYRCSGKEDMLQNPFLPLPSAKVCELQNYAEGHMEHTPLMFLYSLTVPNIYEMLPLAIHVYMPIHF